MNPLRRPCTPLLLLILVAASGCGNSEEGSGASSARDGGREESEGGHGRLPTKAGANADSGAEDEASGEGAPKADPRRLTIRGLVLDETGEPLERCRVRLRNSEGEAGSIETDDHGRFSTPVPDQPHVVQISSPECPEVPLLTRGGLRPGEYLHEFRIPDEARGSVRITGRLRRGGTPLANHSVVWKGARGTQGRGLSDASGQFSFTGLPPDHYELRVAGSVGLSAGPKLLLHEQIWEVGTLDLPALGRLEVQLSRLSDKTLRAVTFWIHNATTRRSLSLPPDSTELVAEDLRPGLWHLGVHGGGVALNTFRFEIATGAPTSLDLRLEDGTPHTLVLHFDKDLPRPRATLRVEREDGALLLEREYQPRAGALQVELVLHLAPGITRFRVQAPDGAVQEKTRDSRDPAARTELHIRR